MSEEPSVMTTTIHADLSSCTISADGTCELKLPNYHTSTLEPFTSEDQVHAHVEEMAAKVAVWQPITEAAPTYRGLTYVEYISHVQIHGPITDEQAVEILSTSVDPSIVLIRLKLEKAGSAIYPDNPIVLGGLDTLVAKDFIDAAGKTAILGNWPTV
ncbi:hypothetical protein [Roseibium sp. MB-4]